MKNRILLRKNHEDMGVEFTPLYFPWELLKSSFFVQKRLEP